MERVLERTDTGHREGQMKSATDMGPGQEDTLGPGAREGSVVVAGTEQDEMRQ